MLQDNIYQVLVKQHIIIITFIKLGLLVAEYYYQLDYLNFKIFVIKILNLKIKSK